jgi:leucine dehydrogenase
MLDSWDGETVVIRRDRETESWIIVALHSSRLGPPTGGTRMKPYPDLEAALTDALRLSRGMTYKFAAPGLPSGGAKAVLMVPPDLDAEGRAGLLRRFGGLVAELDGRFRTGPDLGTTPADMDLVAELGAPHVFSRTVASGGAGNPGPFTAVGVFAGIRAAAARLSGSDALTGVRVVVQGAGDVGEPLIEMLRGAGADVTFSEVDEQRIRRFRDELGCAILNVATIPLLRCAAVVGSANNQLAEPEDAARLRARSILYAPDYVANVGGAMAVPGIELMGWTPERARDEVTGFVKDTLARIFDMASAEDITTDEAARRIAEEHLLAADGSN